MSRALIIGYGNPLRGDDGIGWSAAESLRERLSAYPIQVITTHQLTPELADALAQTDRVLFLDAAEGDPAGVMKIQTLSAVADSPRPALDHTFSPERLLALTRMAYGRCPEAALLTVTGQSFDVGQPLSEAVSQSFPALCSWAAAWAGCSQGALRHA